MNNILISMFFSITSDFDKSSRFITDRLKLAYMAIFILQNNH